jgi:outer membrane protein assembly factor BamB
MRGERRVAGWVACILGALLGGGGAAAGDWPEFRGPTAMGISTAKDLPVRWSATENVVWKQAIPGTGWSSPVLRDGRVYVTTAVETESGGLVLKVLALDAAKGTTLWDTVVFESPVKGPSIHSKNGQASPTPIVTEDRIFVHFGHHGTAALDLKGGIVWHQNGIKYTPVHGNGGSPALVDGLLVFGVDGEKDPRVVALDAKDGKVRWETPRVTPAKRKFSFSTPLVVGESGKRQVISPGSGAVCAYDPKTGTELWRVRYGEGYSVVPRPVLADGMLFLASGYDRPVLHAIRTGGVGDVSDTHVAWTLAKGAPNTPSMVVVDDLLYCVSDSGIASAVEAKTGTVVWSERLGGDFSASIVYADGRLYFQNEVGVGFVVKPGRTFEVLAKNDLGERTLASYAVDDGALFIRTAGHLYRIGK